MDALLNTSTLTITFGCMVTLHEITKREALIIPCFGEKSSKVSYVFVISKPNFRSVLIISILNFSDINECKANTHSCHPKAICTNTFGSYECKCLQGYTGNGKQCRGMHNVAS